MNLRFAAIFLTPLLFTSVSARAQEPGALGPRAAAVWAPETKLNSIPAVAGGSVLLAGGTAMHATGVTFLVVMMGGACSQPPCTKNYALPWGLTLGGLATIAGGVALVVWGAQKVPVRVGSVPAWVGAPGDTGWRWQF